jgi:hypothetical protein
MAGPMNRKRLMPSGVAAAVAVCFASNPVYAVEGGASFYLLGGKLPLSGVVPGPGMYFQNDVYLYSGSAGSKIELPIGGQIVANVDAILAFDAPTLLAVTPWKVLGGQFGVGATFPFGYANIDAQVGIGSISGAVQDDVFTVGDPIGAAFLGWSAGNFHWSITGSVNIPIGDYQEGEIAQISLNRWVADLTAALTWLEPTIGVDLSAVAGVTFNGVNEDTGYNSGNEFHLEAAATKMFGQTFSIGLAGYYNHQISPDSGSRLGDFEGQVAAVGGLASYTFELGSLPVTATARYYHEFDVKNRLQGDAGFITIAMPIWVKPTPATTK